MNGSAAGMWIDLEYAALRGDFWVRLTSFRVTLVWICELLQVISKTGAMFHFWPLVRRRGRGEGRGGEGGGRGEGTQFFRPKPPKKLCFFVQKVHKNILHDLL